MRGHSSRSNGPAPRRSGPPGGGTRPDDARRSRRLVAGLLLGAAGAVDVLAGVSAVQADPYVVADDGFRHLDVTGWGWFQLATGVELLVAALVATIDRRAAALAAIGAGAFAVLLTVALFAYQPVERATSALLAAVAVWLLAGHLRATPRRRPAAPGGRGIN
ncbi:DUF7144 family membrane protein [Micromonospora haikouensis]|uniref:DUF7144 family membrane protein n=1 Tax=Micromonospora haikouensis TaxID=686309 RepID=UPI0037B3FAAE